MARDIKKKPETSSAMRIASDERSRTEIGNGRPGLAIVTTILLGPIALITIPVFWFLGMTLFYAVLLTIFLQLATFLIVVMISFYRSLESTLNCGAITRPFRFRTIASGLDAIARTWRAGCHPRLWFGFAA